MWGGSVDFKTPMLFAMGFVWVFTIGGVTGVVLANPGIDVALHDSYYIVAHFHYVMALGAAFALFAGMYYWLPKMSGRMYPEWAGAVHFWLFFISTNITFFPQHFLGLQGMARRSVDYPHAFAFWNLVSSLGAFAAHTSFVWFIGLIGWTLLFGKKAAANPWGYGATTLEWTLSSPPPYHQFATPPVILAEHH
jgi:cytochrome c oxidase subunit 1